MSTAGMSYEASNEFLALEARLVALLKAATAGMTPAVHVLSAADLADVKLARQHSPAVHVIYGGYSVAEDQGTRALLDHTWHAITVVRHVGDTRTGNKARAEMGPLLATVMSTLLGAQVEGATQRLELTNPPRPWHEAGTQFVPSSFIAQTIFHKTAT